MARRPAALIPLGYGKFVRADRVFALVPLEGDDRGDGRRTLVYVEGIEEPIIASRSEGAIARDVAGALGRGGRSRDDVDLPGQEALFLGRLGSDGGSAYVLRTGRLTFVSGPDHVLRARRLAGLDKCSINPARAVADNRWEGSQRQRRQGRAPT